MLADAVLNTRAHGDADLIPVRMCNEVVYCPRLFHLEHVQGLFVESVDTVEGKAQHERAAKKGTRKRASKASKAAGVADVSAPGETGTATARDAAKATLLPEPELASVDPTTVPFQRTLTSDAWGITGKVDWVELEGGRVRAVEAKHGASPKFEEHQWEGHRLPYGAWPADVAQLALYMALLRDHGLACDEGEILYRGDRRRMRVPWSAELEAFARAVVAKAREVAAQPKAPEPLVNSPKCPRCSLYSICLPDEHHALVQLSKQQEPGEVRRIVAGRDDRAIVHVLTPGTYVRKDGEGLKICPREGEETRVLLKDVGGLALFGAIQVSEQCMQHLLMLGIPVSHHTSGGELLGMTQPLGTRNISLRRAQYRAADDEARCLAVSRSYVIAKVRNQRTVLKRYRRGLMTEGDDMLGGPLPDWAGGEEQAVKDSRKEALDVTAEALKAMKIALDAAVRAPTLDQLRGHEGDAAANYFKGLRFILPPAWRDELRGRSRRPPRDKVNAMLSFGYSLLVREAVAAISRIGLDPMLGLFHTMIPGRPALALDLIEPFRAAWVDTAVLRLLATEGVTKSDFTENAHAVYLNDTGRRALIQAYERRADELITHPRFEYRMSYRRMVELEARILGKWLVGEIDELSPLCTR